MNIKNLKECPECSTNVGISSVPHCSSKACTWNNCSCGVTYDRLKGSSFRSRF